MVDMDSLHIWLGLACGANLLFHTPFTKLIYMYCRWVKTALNFNLMNLHVMIMNLYSTKTIEEYSKVLYIKLKLMNE